VLEDRVDRTQVRSPVKGIVKELMVTTIGGVVQPGMDLVSIVPQEDTLLIETKIRPADIARLYPGQKAMVKFTAYDFTVYGGLEAELVHISADSSIDEQGESFYLVRVKTQTNNLAQEGELLPIIPGMIAQVDILTGKKTLLTYLLKPILKAQQVALTER
jgi:adhesin transport system membrane fusion protein